MKVLYVVCAAGSSVDSKTNQLSLFNVLDEIGGAAFPLLLPNLCVASMFEREPADEPVQSYVTTIRLNDVMLASFAMQVDFGRSRRNRCVNSIQGLTFPAPGAITIDIRQKSVVLGTWELLAIRLGEVAAPAKPARSDAPPPMAKPGPTVN